MGVWRVALLGREWESGTAVDTMQLDGNVDMDMLALYFGFDVSGSYVTCANCARPPLQAYPPLSTSSPIP